MTSRNLLLHIWCLSIRRIFVPLGLMISIRAVYGVMEQGADVMYEERV